MNYAKGKPKKGKPPFGPTKVAIVAAKDQLSALVTRALAGEDIVITRHGEAAVRLSRVLPPTPNAPTPRVPGLYPELAHLADEIMTPLSDEELARFYDGPVFPDPAS
jgi:antitoxin (DNA-binding transcriptional repressor) of toxin-antitoxin stability system